MSALGLAVGGTCCIRRWNAKGRRLNQQITHRWFVLDSTVCLLTGRRTREGGERAIKKGRKRETENKRERTREMFGFEIPAYCWWRSYWSILLVDLWCGPSYLTDLRLCSPWLVKGIFKVTFFYKNSLVLVIECSDVVFGDCVATQAHDAWPLFARNLLSY
jgi:hypothetical protein